MVQGRIKSLHSMHRKMARKGVSLREIFDARALRVVVDDQLGRKLQPAIEACYAIQPAVHRLWRPIRGELDDYIFNPKPSGYQSLHSAVLGERLHTCRSSRSSGSNAWEIAGISRPVYNSSS